MIRGTCGPAWVPGFIGDSVPAEGNQGPNDSPPNSPAEGTEEEEEEQEVEAGGKVVQGVRRDTWDDCPPKERIHFSWRLGSSLGWRGVR